MLLILGLLVLVVVLVQVLARRSRRAAAAAPTVTNVLQLPELDGPRYRRRSGKRRHRATEGRP